MKYKLNICVPVESESVGESPLPSAVFACPVCEGNVDQCTFCNGTGQVTEEELSTYQPTIS